MVIIIVGGNEHSFVGDELTSPEQQAIEFLKAIDKSGKEF